VEIELFDRGGEGEAARWSRRWSRPSPGSQLVFEQAQKEVVVAQTLLGGTIQPGVRAAAA